MIRGVGAAVLAAVVLTGCSGGGGGNQAAPPATTAAPSGTPSGSATPSATAAAPELPSGCEELLPFGDLDEALGRPLFGSSRYTKGVAQPSIGRTGRITCGFGLGPTGKGAPPIEVGISDYTDVEAATKRVQATISQLRGIGAIQSEATVGGLPATVLGTGTVLTLVLAQGSRTVAITLQRALKANLGQGVTIDKATTNVAEKVLANLGT